jgi:hypothetical protein
MSADIFKHVTKNQLDQMPASLGGRSIAPINGPRIHGSILIPSNYRRTNEEDEDLICRWLDEPLEDMDILLSVGPYEIVNF